MILKTQAEEFSNDLIRVGVVETIIKNSPFFTILPFETMVGNSIKYNLEVAQASVSFHQVDGVWVESTRTTAQRSAALTILGGDADVDNFLLETRSNVTNLQAESLEGKSKAVAHKYQTELVFGGTTSTPATDGFDGILKFIAERESTSTTDLDGLNNDAVVVGHATSATLTLAMIDELLDAVPGGAQFIMTTKRMRRKISSLMRVAGASLGYMTMDADLGVQARDFAGLPLFTNDFLLDNMPDNDGSSVCDIAAWAQATTRAGTVDNTPIIAGRVGGKDFIGLQSPSGLQVEPVGTVQNKDAIRYRVKWYCSAMMENSRACAVLIGATDGL